MIDSLKHLASKVVVVVSMVLPLCRLAVRPAPLLFELLGLRGLPGEGRRLIGCVVLMTSLRWFGMYYKERSKSSDVRQNRFQ